MDSYFVGFLVKIATWGRAQFDNSRLINRFLIDKSNREGEASNLSVLIPCKIGLLLRRLFFALKLNKLFVNSIFAIPMLWCFLTAIVAPLLPTKLVIVATVSGYGSLALALLCKNKEGLCYSPLNKYIYLYSGVYLFGTLTSVALKGSLFGGALTVFFILFSIVFSNSIETKMQIRVLIFLLSGVGVLISLYGFYQFLNPSKFSGVWHDIEMFESIRFRVYSTLENPNVLGEYFLLLMPLTFCGVLTEKPIILKLYYLGCLGVMMLCLILTYSRGCYIGILCAIGVFLILLDRRFIILGVIGLLMLPFILPETIINRFMSIGDMTDSSTSYRVSILLATIAMLKDYWLCGIGPGTEAFNLVYPAYAFNGVSAPHSHNLFLQVICDSGIMGFIIFMAFIYKLYKITLGTLYRTPKSNWIKHVYLIGIVSSITGFFIQSLFDYTFYNYRVMLFFWIVVGLGISITRLKNEEEAVCD